MKLWKFSCIEKLGALLQSREDKPASPEVQQAKGTIQIQRGFNSMFVG